MNVGKILGIFSIGAASAIFVDLVKNAYVLRKPYPFARAGAAITAFTILGILAYSLSREKTEEPTEVNSYSGIILNPNEVRETCYCEPIIQIRCYAKGAIGALSKEQALKYCREEYLKLEEKVKEISQKKL